MSEAKNLYYPDNPTKPFGLIFFVELWERFGWYGMQTLLLYFLIKNLGYPDDIANHIFGAFSALAYAFLSLGGYIGDKVLGCKRTIVFGAIVLAAGYLILGINPSEYIFIGLAIIVVGNAIFKPNPSSLVSKLFKPGDHRVDGAFTMYYMAINIGSFAACLSVPYIAKHVGWGSAFGVSFIGLILAVLGYLIFNKILKNTGSAPDFEKMDIRKLLGVIAGTILLIIICWFLLKHILLAKALLYVIILLLIGICVRLTFIVEPNERKPLIVCLILICEAIIFYVLYIQRATSINLFVIRNTYHSIFGIPLEPLAFQSFNPLWILACSPVLAYIFNKAAKKGKQLSMPSKFAFGMLLCSLGFLIMKFGALFFADSAGKIAGEWVFIGVGLLSVGEIFIGGLGLAMVARLVPQRVMGLMMGVWFMATAVAMILGGYVAAIASIPKNITDPILSLPIYTGLFFKLGIATFVIGLIMRVTAPLLDRYVK